MGQVLHRSATTTEVVRRAIQHSEREPEGAGQAPRRQPEDDRQVAQAVVDSRSANRTQGAQVHDADNRGGGGGRGVPTPHAAAARRLPLRATGDDSASDPLLAAPLPATSWHQSAARC